MGKVNQLVKLEREKRKTAREEKLWQILTAPSTLRLLQLATLLYGTRAVRDIADDNMGVRDVSAALAALGSVAILADAGVHDKYALAAIALTGGAAVGEGKSGIVAIGKGAWESDALVRIDPTKFSGILSAITE